MKINIFLIVFFTALIFNINAQCPTHINISSNAKCLQMSWTIPPTPLPPTAVVGAETYTYVSGSGTTANPALYNNGSSQGCNNYIGFTGTITIGQYSCTYSNGTLTNQTLPLNLLDFQLSSRRGFVELKWKTSKESDVAGFEVQRMDDKSQWTSIEWIECSGKDYTATNSYNYLDMKPSSGQNYYRLKIVDNNGSQEYSPVVSYIIENKEYLEICPNPVIDRLFVCNTTNGNEISTLDFYNAHGARISGTDIFSNSIDIHQFKPGIYILKAGFTDGTFQVRKFIKD